MVVSGAFGGSISRGDDDLRVGEGSLVGDVQDNAVVLVVVVDSPLRLERVGNVAFSGLEKDRLVEVGTEGLVVDLPFVVASGVHDERELEVFHEWV